MLVDLSNLGPKGVIDVRNARRIYSQVSPRGAVGSAGLLLKCATSPDPTAPSVSHGSESEVDLSGADIVELDVEHAGWLHVVCDDEQSGAAVDLFTYAPDIVQGETVEQIVDLTAKGQRTPLVDVRRYDRAFVLADTVLSNSAVLEARATLDPSVQPVAYSPAATINLAGTLTEIDVSGAAYLSTYCTTAQSGQRARLFWYFRTFIPANIKDV